MAFRDNVMPWKRMVIVTSVAIDKFSVVQNLGDSTPDPG